MNSKGRFDWRTVHLQVVGVNEQHVILCQQMQGTVASADPTRHTHPNAGSISDIDLPAEHASALLIRRAAFLPSPPAPAHASQVLPILLKLRPVSMSAADAVIRAWTRPKEGHLRK